MLKNLFMRDKLVYCLLLLIHFSAGAQKETTVYFDFDQFELTENAKSTLGSFLANRKIASIDIFGHCDQLGSKQYNYRLSEKRANAVREYLIAKGFNAVNIQVRGFGEDQPIINKLDEISRRANRRVTIISTYATASADTAVIHKAAPSDTPAVITPTPQVKVQRKEKLLDEIKDTSTKTGQNIILKNINFYGGSHRFLPSSYDALEELLDAMQKIPTLVIEIQGHICCREDEGDGMDNDTGEPILSYNRARAVYYFLARNGIDQRRMTYKGYGHKYPIYDIEFNEEERTANRRVEIKILRK